MFLINQIKFDYDTHYPKNYLFIGNKETSYLW